jgi:hypothetical protein
LKMDSAKVAANEPELDELGDRRRPYATAPGLWHQGDPDFGMAGERIELEKRYGPDCHAADLNHEAHVALRRIGSSCSARKAGGDRRPSTFVPRLMTADRADVGWDRGRRASRSDRQEFGLATEARVTGTSLGANLVAVFAAGTV